LCQFWIETPKDTRVIGVWGFLYQFAYVLFSGTFSAISLWFYFHQRRKVNTFGILAIPAFLYLFVAFLSHAERMFARHHLDVAQISSMSYKGRDFREPGKIQAVADALQRSVWYARPRRSGTLGPSHLLVLRYANGSDWILTTFQYRHGSAMVLEISSPNLPSGYAYNSELEQVLEGQ
jgi:hypothetical protein